ncbi:MAG: hypothetical protein ABJG78_03295 [Cyclobacteriaceae bacterium]
MKYLLLALSLAAVLGTTSAQQFVLKTYTEKTKISTKTGTAFGIENRYGWEYGGFYQESSLMESLLSNEKKANLPRFYEKEFYGMYFSAPVMDSKYVVLKAHVRTGVSNGQNFVITPSFFADYNPSHHIRFGVGVGTRAFRPTLQGSLSILF